MTNSEMTPEQRIREALVNERHPAVTDVAKWFGYNHLPPGLPRDVSQLFASTAAGLLDVLPDSASLTTALRSLLMAKDEAVRAALSASGHQAASFLLTD